MKVAINTCFGGFSLSNKALMLYCEKKYGCAYLYDNVEENVYVKIPITPNSYEDFNYYISSKDFGDVADYHDIEPYIIWNTNFYSDEARTEPLLINVIEELGEEANGSAAKLKIVEIPDGIKWYIKQYDGKEIIEEVHRSWN